MSYYSFPPIPPLAINRTIDNKNQEPKKRSFQIFQNNSFIIQVKKEEEEELESDLELFERILLLLSHYT